MSDPAHNQPFTVYVIPHTHWDREWYAPFQHFRLRLVRLMDALLNLLERDAAYTHFNLDAQTIVLQDYLEIRPEKRVMLQRFVTERRLGVGPWYVLPDEFLVSGEALVRNLLLGHRLAGEFGHIQKVGYIPDTFGHISQLPQILRGFDIGTAMHFRGLDEGRLKSELRWQAPDGSQVLLRHLPTDLGYVGAAALALDPQAAANDLQALARYETQRATTSILLALNGVDHMPAREDLPAVLALANQQAPDHYIFRQASLEEYFDALTQGLGDQPLQTIEGELRDTSRTPGRGMRVLPHILSSRIYNKLQNERAQTLLEHWAEPWSTLLWTQGADYPAAFLGKAWEWVLQNQPHDSIGGCSVDAVHAQMETRFQWATEIAGEVTRERFHLLAQQLDLARLEPDEAALIVFNGLPWAWEGAVEVDIDLWNFYLNQVAMNRWKPPLSEAAITPEMEAPEIFRWRTHHQWAENPPILPDAAFRGLRLRPLDSAQSLPVQIESIARTSILRPLVTGPASFRDVVRVRAAFEARLPAYGYQVYAVRPEGNPNKPFTVAHPHNILENEHLHVRIKPNGTLTLTDKITGQVYTDLGYFEDGGDCGDSYNYSYPLEDRVTNTLGLAPEISQLAAGPVVQRYRIDYRWELPVGLDDLRRRRSEARTVCPISVTVSLTTGSPRLDLQVTVDNHARDHRLRLVFPSDVNTGVSHAEAQFDVVTRPIRVTPVPAEAWAEDAPTTLPQQSWADLSDGQRGLCLINQGLPEYEVLDTPRRELAITLLRAVGYLGAGTEMQTANIGAGPNIATPEGQIQRQLTFALAVLPHAGTWELAEVWRQARAHTTPPQAITTGMVKNYPAPSGSRGAHETFLSVEGHNVVLSALKKAEQGESLILRLHNPSDTATEAVITLPFVASQCLPVGLDEQPGPHAANADNLELAGERQVRLTLPPKKIITLRIDRA